MISQDKDSELREQIRLPYGSRELDPQVAQQPGSPRRVRCYVKDCTRILRTPTRYYLGDVCPDHQIRCHFSSAGATYSYPNAARNIIASPSVFRRHIVGHPYKYESHRLGSERSEDALSWNVFRSLHEADQLTGLAEAITGELIGVRPFLYLWGICVSDDRFEPWDLLEAARRRFESRLPVVRPKTEPDIALHLPGKYLILIEAKFTSPNTSYKHGPRKDRGSLTLEELLAIYQDRELQLLDRERALKRTRIFYQLWRNTVFAEWMARLDHPKTRAFHVNLVRQGQEQDAAREFGTLLADRYRHRFQRLTWEGIYELLCRNNPRLQRLSRYLETKTEGLKPAFQLGSE